MKKLTSPFVHIKVAFDIFTKKENFISLIKLYIPIGVISLISLLFINIPFLSEFSAKPAGNLIMISLDILLTLIAVFVNLAGIIAIIEIEKGVKVDLKKIYRLSFLKYWKFFILTCVIYLLSGLGLVLLVIPFFLFTTWFAFSKFEMVEKELGIKESLSRSKVLSRGMFWKVLYRIFVFVVFTLLCQMVLGSLPYGIGAVLFYLFGGLFILPVFLLYKEIDKNSISG